MRYRRMRFDDLGLGDCVLVWWGDILAILTGTRIELKCPGRVCRSCPLWKESP